MESDNGMRLPRLAVVTGARTPQAKAFGALARVSAVELSVHATSAALARAGLSPDRVDEVVMGNVSGPADSANIARVIALKSSVPYDRIAHTVNRNCASGMEAIIGGWLAIATGRAQIVVAGGTESMSQVPMLVSEKTKAKLMAAGRAKSLFARLSAYAQLRASDLKPVFGIELGLTDPTCGLNMGQTAEILADEFSITRDEQDAFALQSHLRAVAATESSFLSGEIAPVSVGGKEFKADVGPRAQQSLEQLAKLKP
ncbi:MAG: thiolase family protein, partial [Aureliella sp.]